MRYKLLKSIATIIFFGIITTPAFAQVTGACCLENGTMCMVWTESDCLSNDGEWKGEGTDCTDADENGVADVCEEAATGACCLEGGSMCMEWTETECSDNDGTWQGEGTVCLGDSDSNGIDDACEQSSPTGACCLEGGAMCMVWTESDCLTNGGEWKGEGTDCTDDDENSVADVCEAAEPTGACCLEEGGTMCMVWTESDCLSNGGEWKGEGTDCTDDDESGVADVCETAATGACCYLDGTYCIVTDETDCADSYQGTWMGEGTDCSDDNESGVADVCEASTTGACCYNDGTDCAMTDENGCDYYYQGTWMGYGTDCADADENSVADVCEAAEPTGACCLEDGTMCMVWTESDCLSNEGEWMGEGTDCTDTDENGTADACEESDAYDYLPGDANMAAETWPAQTIGGDVTYLVNYFRGLADPCNLDGFYASADATGDCMVVGGDVTYLVNYFRGLADMSYCSDYEPAWPTPSDVPADAPDGWPNCD